LVPATTGNRAWLWSPGERDLPERDTGLYARVPVTDFVAECVTECVADPDAELVT
jgi:hypothetical protein